MRFKGVLVTLFCLFLFFLNACSQQYSGKKQPKAINGVLDLRDWDFDKDGPVKLDGEWEFYWKQLLFPKDFKTGLGRGKPMFMDEY